MPEFSTKELPIAGSDQKQTTKFVVFSLAFDQSSGNKIYSSISVSAFGKQANIIETLLVGQEVCVSGTLKILSEESLEIISKSPYFNPADRQASIMAKTITTD